MLDGVQYFRWRIILMYIDVISNSFGSVYTENNFVVVFFFFFFKLKNDLDFQDPATIRER